MNKKVLIITELGMTHNGSASLAKRLIDSAIDSGVDAVKFQMHIFDEESLPDAPSPKYFTSESRKEFFKRTSFTVKQWIDIKNHIKNNGKKFVCSPFSVKAVELLEKIGVDIYKIPSGEVTNTPYLEVVSNTKKPVILSTGMNNWKELDNAVKTITRYNKNLSIMQCTSSYPCSYKEVGLNVIKEMRERYGLPIGLSDHTLTIYASLAAVTLGANIIERHFTIDKKIYGPDAKFSLVPAEMKNLVEGIRNIEIMLNNKVDKNDVSKFKDMKYIFEKSIVSKNNIYKNTIITSDLLDFKKPGDGIRADRIKEVIGKRAKVDIPKNIKILLEHLK